MTVDGGADNFYIIAAESRVSLLISYKLIAASRMMHSPSLAGIRDNSFSGRSGGHPFIMLIVESTWYG